MSGALDVARFEPVSRHHGHTVASVPSSSATMMTPRSGWRCATVTFQASGSNARRRSTVSLSRRRLTSGSLVEPRSRDNSSCLPTRSVCCRQKRDLDRTWRSGRRLPAAVTCWGLSELHVIVKNSHVLARAADNEVCPSVSRPRSSSCGRGAAIQWSRLAFAWLRSRHRSSLR